MSLRMHTTLLQILSFVYAFISSARAQVGLSVYANDFVDPDYILAGGFGAHTERAQANIVDWANIYGSSGPWSVMDKSVTPPSGDKHDYMSWAPYWWPDCSKVGNTTALTPEQVWVTCPYVSRDGQFNPDGRTVNDVGNFGNVSEAVFYNAIAWTFGTADKDTFEANTVRFLRTWFLDSDTKMNPNLIYGQMQRGPTGQVGTHTGILDLKNMAKVATAILILRKGKSTAWTNDLDNQMLDWTKQYTSWLETAAIAVEEGQADNNHGTFYYNQLAALKLILNDTAGAKSATNTYYTKQYLAQISANGEQPLEAERTRPYHYRSYNLAAMITNARLAMYADPSSRAFNLTTSAGATIKTALDFAMTISASASKEDSIRDEIYPNVAAVASVYGDPDGKYLTFMEKAEPNFITEPFILWNQPWAESVTSGAVVSSSSVKAVATKSTTSKKAGATGSNSTNTSGALAVWNMKSWFSLSCGLLAAVGLLTNLI